MLHKLSP